MQQPATSVAGCSYAYAQSYQRDPMRMTDLFAT